MSELPTAHMADSTVDEALDAQLRALLHQCFSPLGDSGFLHKRYHNEPPASRFFIRDDHGLPIAHLAVHHKQIAFGSDSEPFIGIAEVCVAPQWRRQGLVRQLLDAAETGFADQAYAILLGDARVYGSSSYTVVDNVRFPDVVREVRGIMIKCLGSTLWPTEATGIIRGPTF